jgi:outer membrane immunogenic protein
MRIATFGVVLLAAASATNQVWATDIATPVYKAPPVPVSANTDWAGFYIGAHGGYAWGDPTLDFDPAQVPLPESGPITGFAPASPFTLSSTPKGAFGGLQLGYNWQFGRTVYGIETDVSLANAGGQRAERDFTNQFRLFSAQSRTIGNVSLESRLRVFGTVRGRLGYASHNVLVYATGGLAWERIENTVTAAGETTQDSDSSVNFVGSFNNSQSLRETLFGYAVGGGLEIALDAHWSARGEYMFLGFPDHRRTLNEVSPAATLSSGLDLHIVRAGLSYRF